METHDYPTRTGDIRKDCPFCGLRYCCDAHHATCCDECDAMQTACEAHADFAVKED